MEIVAVDEAISKLQSPVYEQVMALIDGDLIFFDLGNPDFE